jgi:hypothetical protein
MTMTRYEKLVHDFSLDSSDQRIRMLQALMSRYPSETSTQIVSLLGAVIADRHRPRRMTLADMNDAQLFRIHHRLISTRAHDRKSAELIWISNERMD